MQRRGIKAPWCYEYAVAATAFCLLLVLREVAVCFSQHGTPTPLNELVLVTYTYEYHLDCSRKLEGSRFERIVTYVQALGSPRPPSPIYSCARLDDYDYALGTEQLSSSMASYIRNLNDTKTVETTHILDSLEKARVPGTRKRFAPMTSFWNIRVNMKESRDAALGSHAKKYFF